MIDFSNFKTEDGKPIYLQILYYIKRGAASGSIQDGDELPSRRVLSALLGINPNTVQKAFKQLEDEGLIESHSGAKSVMVLSAERIETLRAELLAEDIRSLTAALKNTGVGKFEALQLINQYWDEETEHDAESASGSAEEVSHEEA